MNLIQCRYASGQRVPLLVQDGQAVPLPKLVPFIYVQLKLRHRAYNTAAAHLRAIQAFYTYAKTRDLDKDWSEAQLNMTLHLSFELGPRSIQFHSLDIADFEFIESADHERYYTLWLPMAKKVGQRRPERRPRKITTRLGEKISQHVAEMRRRFGGDCEPLLVSPNGRRMSVTEIGVSLKHELCKAGINKPN